MCQIGLKAGIMHAEILQPIPFSTQKYSYVKGDGL